MNIKSIAVVFAIASMVAACECNEEERESEVLDGGRRATSDDCHAPICEPDSSEDPCPDQHCIQCTNTIEIIDLFCVDVGPATKAGMTRWACEH